MNSKQFPADCQAATDSPPDVAALLARAVALHQAGQLAEAMMLYQQLLALVPGHAQALHLSGVVQLQTGRHAEACALIQQAIALLPWEADFYCSLGNALLGLAQFTDAADAYGKGLTLQPGSPAILCNLGVALKEQGEYAQARQVLEEAVRAQPDLAPAWNNLGIVRSYLGDATQAVIAYRRALAIDPQFADAWQNLAVALEGQGQLDAAEAACRRALGLNPSMAEGYHQLAIIKLKAGEVQEAIPACAHALALDPGKSEVLCDLVMLLKTAAAWDELPVLLAELETRRAAGKQDFQPFVFLSLPTSAQDQLAVARAHGQAQAAAAAPLTPTAKQAGERLRIGYLSYDLRVHATAYLVAEVLELHDRERFEVFVYSYGPDDSSAIRHRIMAGVEHFVDIAGLSHWQAAQRIREDGIDILVDLKGYTQGGRAAILAHRPAPIQVNWLGYPGTMGADFIDYIIADPFIIPKGQEHHYSEKVLRLPDCYQPNDRRRAIDPRTLGRSECGLPEHGFVFCCFNQPYKITPGVFDVWMRLLQQVPGSVLWLLGWNRPAIDNLRAQAAARGVAPARLIFAPGLPLPQHLARYRIADLFVDTFPFGAHTAASDALWAGLPVLTLIGDTFASRVAGSLLHAAGLPELVTHSLEAYEALALAMAGEPGRLGALRQRLAINRDTCALFDTPRFVRHLEAAYLAI